MEPKFTIPYSEFMVAEVLQEKFKPKSIYSIYIPASRQQKGVDLLLVRQNSIKTTCLTIQVKSSRVWNNLRQTSKMKSHNIIPKFSWWFKKFEISDDSASDVYLLTGYTIVNESQKISGFEWKPIIFYFDKQDMKDLLATIEGWNIYFTMDQSGKVFITRGLNYYLDITDKIFCDFHTNRMKEMLDEV